MSVLIYNIFLRLFALALYLVSPWNLKARLWVKGRTRIFDRLSEEIGKNESPLVWMHCASVGELEQGKPVIEEIRKAFPAWKVLVTFFSSSGYEASKTYKGADYIFYLPHDGAHNARRFLKVVNPSLVLWVKYEYWYYYLTELKKREVPVLLVSGVFKKQMGFFKWYGSLYVTMLKSFSHLFVQTEDSKSLLATIGFNKNVTISGDTRFDRVVEIAERFKPIPVIDQFCGDRQVFVAGSTWEEDEEVLQHFANSHREIKFIIAPHEIDDQHIHDLQGRFQKSILFSQYAARPATEQQLRVEEDENHILIIDNIGMLSRLYHYATVSYVGGGFGDSGVHNVLEAAVYGKPVIFGPVYEKYIEADELVDAGGGIPVGDALQFETILNKLLNSKEEYINACQASSNYVYAKKGATAKIMMFVNQLQWHKAESG